MTSKIQIKHSLVIKIGLIVLDTFTENLFVDLARKFNTETLPDAAHRIIENEG